MLDNELVTNLRFGDARTLVLWRTRTVLGARDFAVGRTSLPAERSSETAATFARRTCFPAWTSASEDFCAIQLNAPFTVGPHRSTAYRCDLLLYRWSSVVTLSVGRWQSWALRATDQDAVWDVDSGGPKEACVRRRSHWHHMANTIELSMCGGDTALCENTLITCFLIIWRS